MQFSNLLVLLVSIVVNVSAQPGWGSSASPTEYGSSASPVASSSSSSSEVWSKTTSSEGWSSSEASSTSYSSSVASASSSKAWYPTGNNGTYPTATGSALTTSASPTWTVPVVGAAPTRLAGHAFGLLAVGGIALVL